LGFVPRYKLVILLLFRYTSNKTGGFVMADAVVYVDVADGAKRVMNNTKLYIRLLAKFKEETTLDDIDAALAAGDFEKAQSASHTLKGVAGNLSLVELFKQCLELENQIKAKAPSPAQIETVRAVFAATMQEVDKVVAEHG
jgi:HPt (histidine-containing phosphotransfer) domain-containing protein